MEVARGVVGAFRLLAMRRVRGTCGSGGPFRDGDPFLAEELGSGVVTPFRKAMIRPVGGIVDAQKKSPADLRRAHGRYKTRTCDLHDVNVAL